MASSRSTSSTSRVSHKTTHKIPKGSAEHKIERRRYLTQLTHEFGCTNSREARLQVMANLANFAYDPYNYELFRELRVVDMFLYQLQNGKDAKLVEFSLGGLCNCSPDEHIKQEIIRGGGISLLSSILMLPTKLTSSVASKTSAITTLMSLVTPYTRQEILTNDLKNVLNNLCQHEDTRVRNLSEIFLRTYFM